MKSRILPWTVVDMSGTITGFRRAALHVDGRLRRLWDGLRRRAFGSAGLASVGVLFGVLALAAAQCVLRADGLFGDERTLLGGWIAPFCLMLTSFAAIARLRPSQGRFPVASISLLCVNLIVWTAVYLSLGPVGDPVDGFGGTRLLDFTDVPAPAANGG